jgi:transcriptional regulator GlxA family with amidase domain
MLVATDLRVREIALLCGYPIASHFATVFSARYGTPPLEFRTSRAATHRH